MFVYDQSPLKSAAELKKQLYVTWFEEDDELVQPIVQALSERGTAVVLAPRSVVACQHNDYIQNATDRISTCNVGLVMLSKAVFAPENQELQQVMWYEIGFMMSLGMKLVLFFLDIPPRERNDYLNTTPVRQVQGTDSVDSLMEIIETNDVQEKVFYEDAELNRYASRRVNYYRLTTMFNIYKKDMDAIFDDLYDPDDDDDDDDELETDAHLQKAEQQMLTEMLAEIGCGCTVLSFNHQESLNGALEPYFPEVHTIVRDYPIHQDYSKPKLMNQETSPEIYATVQAEFILPVHALLGVTFKPFVSVGRRSRFRPDHIARIIESNGEGADAVVMKKGNEQRLYFLLGMYKTESWEEFAAYGTWLNHIWPQ